LKWAKDVQHYFDPETLWTRQIKFYFDGKSFVHKTNPRDQARAPGARIWRRSSEGLHEHCTSKGSKAGNSGKVAHFFVAMSHSSGVVLCEQYEKLTGQMFADFVKEHFLDTFQRCGNSHEDRCFLMDNDPSQNSKKAQHALHSIHASPFTIPPRSADCNPIENMFSWVERKLTEQAIERNITHETFPEFCVRIKETVMSCPTTYIDNLIESMPRRITKIIETNGKRLRY